VTIKAFALGKYNVTSEQFLTFLRETGYQPPACNSILDMKWQSPGHGRAYAPYSGEPPRWPAVCLDWHDAEKYISWLYSRPIGRESWPPRDEGERRQRAIVPRSGVSVCPRPPVPARAARRVRKRAASAQQ
jgi:formylglycine-generating enzyme required for sulfatase activity